MSKFINYDVNSGLSINTFRKPGFTVGDIGDVVTAYQNGRESVACILEGAENALTDGEYLQGSDCSHEGVEAVYNFIRGAL